MEIKKVAFILMAQEMDRAISFYRDVIGLELRVRQGQNWAELGYVDAVVALHGGGDGEYRRTGLAFTVADVAAACDEVSQGGGRIIQPPEARPGEGILLARLADPEGNGFDLSQRTG